MIIAGYTSALAPFTMLNVQATEHIKTFHALGREGLLFTKTLTIRRFYSHGENKVKELIKVAWSIVALKRSVFNEWFACLKGSEGCRASIIVNSYL